MVAPNSPIALANPSTMPARMPASANGNVTVAKSLPGAATRVAMTATRSDSRIAVHSVGEISNTSGGRTDQVDESVLLKHGLGGRRAQEIEIARRRRLRGRGRCDRIDDGGVGIGWEGTDDLDAGLDLGVSRIDNAERGFAACYQRQSRAHAFGHREFRLGRLPCAEL